MQTFVYQDYVKNLHQTFLKRLDDIAVEFNFDYGYEFEIAICEILRSFLPIKYGICRGFVVSAEGEVAGDDIIIYDQERFPTLRPSMIKAFDKKEKIPIEAVYGYIEAKYTLDSNSFDKSFTQTQKVKILCSQREKVNIYQLDPHIQPDKFLPYPISNWPDYRNPVFCMIISRYCVGVDGKTRSTSADDVDIFLKSKLKDIDIHTNLPDLVVAGEHNFLSPALVQDGKNNPSLHFITNVTNSYQVIKKLDIAFGAGLAQLAGAIDWARLGRMPWLRIVNDSRFPESECDR